MPSLHTASQKISCSAARGQDALTLSVEDFPGDHNHASLTLPDPLASSSCSIASTKLLSKPPAHQSLTKEDVGMFAGGKETLGTRDG